LAAIYDSDGVDCNSRSCEGQKLFTVGMGYHRR
jgi:hypothetical protein